MKKFKSALWFVKNSLKLDSRFFRISRWKISKKVHFIALKYFLIIRHFFRQFKIGRSFAIFSGRKIFYDSRYGLAGYQSMLTRLADMIRIAGIRDARCVIDVGANVGFFSMMCRDIFPDCRIWAFEPVEPIFKCLESNFHSDDGTTCLNFGLSDFSGPAEMTFLEADSAVSAIAERGNEKVALTTLDEFLSGRDIPVIDILKIDTETFEAHVLRGAPDALSRTRYLFLEITMENNSNYSISSLLKLLADDKYEFQLVAFRNYADKSEGEMPIMDALFKNIKLAE